MNREDVIRTAREAGLLRSGDGWTAPHRLGATEVERFAVLVAAAEREACAKVCDEREIANLYGVKESAAAIRARSNK